MTSCDGGNRWIVTRINTTSHAGAKAPADVRAICRELSFKPIDLPPVPEDRLAPANLKRFGVGGAKLVWHGLSRSDHDIVVLQHPIVGRLENRLLPELSRRAKSICFVHDLDIIRKPTGQAYQDAEILDLFDVVVAHNGSMAGIVRDLAPGPEVVSLDIFDYLSAKPFVPPAYAASPRHLYVIGNLHPMKAKYLYALDSLPSKIIAYGPNCATGDLARDVVWRGVLDMHEPCLGEVDGFGLVWDGESPDGLEGDWGAYLKVNTPHKLSFYCMLGMPGVGPAEAASAPVVEAEGIGISVGSIAEAAERVASCSEDQWRDHVSAVQAMRGRLANGHYTKRAIGRALAAVEAR